MALTAYEFLKLQPVHDQLLVCTNCGNTYNDFRLAVDADAPAGITLQPILDFINE